MDQNVLGSPGITSFLTELAIMTASCLSSATNNVLCSITLVREGGPAVLASSDSRAASLDVLQNGFGDGPCVTALREEATTVVPDLLAEERWSGFAEAAAGQGVRSVVAVPLDFDGEAHGVANLYSEQVNGFTDLDVLTAEHFVANASRSLQLALSMAGLKDTQSDLLAAMQSRTIIDMAVGVIMARNGSSQEEAVRVLSLGAGG